jgi:hypothetical protein
MALPPSEARSSCDTQRGAEFNKSINDANGGQELSGDGASAARETCVCCGAPFERPTHTRDGRRALRQPQQWRRQRFCSTECVRHYRLQGLITETLPPYLAALEPVKPR